MTHKNPLSSDVWFSFLVELGTRQILPAGARRNISILNNRIEDCAWPLIHVTSTSGLTIERNVLPGDPSRQADDLKGKPIDAILLENCDRVKPAR